MENQTLQKSKNGGKSWKKCSFKEVKKSLIKEFGDNIIQELNNRPGVVYSVTNRLYRLGELT